MRAFSQDGVLMRCEVFRHDAGAPGFGKFHLEVAGRPASVREGALDLGELLTLFVATVKFAGKREAPKDMFEMPAEQLGSLLYKGLYGYGDAEEGRAESEQWARFQVSVESVAFSGIRVFVLGNGSRERVLVQGDEGIGVWAAETCRGAYDAVLAKVVRYLAVEFREEELVKELDVRASPPASDSSTS